MKGSVITLDVVCRSATPSNPMSWLHLPKWVRQILYSDPVVPERKELVYYLAYSDKFIQPFQQSAGFNCSGGNVRALSELRYVRTLEWAPPGALRCLNNHYDQLQKTPATGDLADMFHPALINLSCLNFLHLSAGAPIHHLPPVKAPTSSKKKGSKHCFACGRKTGLASSYECR